MKNFELLSSFIQLANNILPMVSMSAEVQSLWTLIKNIVNIVSSVLLAFSVFEVINIAIKFKDDRQARDEAIKDVKSLLIGLAIAAFALKIIQMIAGALFTGGSVLQYF